MDITEILNVFPSEELNLDGDETKEIFGFQNNQAPRSFFSYFPQSNEIELSACKYLIKILPI